MGDKDPSHEQPKLPQSRMYLKSAQWGFDELLAKKSATTRSAFI
jgi:hypothetical protein